MCEHVMTSGKNKGKLCGKPKDFHFETHVKLNFCNTHKDKHKDEWGPKVREIAQKQLEQALKEQNEFDSKLDNREITAQFIFNNWRKQDKSPNLFREVQKDPNSDIIKEMDKVLSRIAFEDVFKTTLSGDAYVGFRVFPCDWCGYTKEEVVSELEKRGFSPAVYEEDKNCILVRFNRCRF